MTNVWSKFVCVFKVNNNRFTSVFPGNPDYPSQYRWLVFCICWRQMHLPLFIFRLHIPLNHFLPRSLWSTSGLSTFNWRPTETGFFKFSAVNENANKNVDSFSAENERKSSRVLTYYNFSLWCTLQCLRQLQAFLADLSHYTFFFLTCVLLNSISTFLSQLS